MAVRIRNPRRPGFIAAAVLLLALAGCGTAAAPGAGPGSASPGGKGSASPVAAKVALAFAIAGGTGTAPSRWTLRCDPPGGTHPDPAAACSKLLRIKEPFAPPKHQMCPMIMVSNRQVTVTGTWFGTRVHRVFIDGGCDLTMFNEITTQIMR